MAKQHSPETEAAAIRRLMLELACAPTVLPGQPVLTTNGSIATMSTRTRPGGGRSCTIKSRLSLWQPCYDGFEGASDALQRALRLLQSAYPHGWKPEGNAKGNAKALTEYFVDRGVWDELRGYGSTQSCSLLGFCPE